MRKCFEEVSKSYSFEHILEKRELFKGFFKEGYQSRIYYICIISLIQATKVKKELMLEKNALSEEVQALQSQLQSRDNQGR